MEHCCLALLGDHLKALGAELEQKQRDPSWVGPQEALQLPLRACEAWFCGTYWARWGEEGQKLPEVRFEEGVACPQV